MRVITHRRICWPKPDATCLNGGCLYCEGGPWKSIRELRVYARETGVIHHRASGSDDATVALEYGLARRFFGQPVRWDERKRQP